MTVSAERTLARFLGGPGRLGIPEPIGGGERHRSTVVRYPLVDGPSGAPRTVVAKLSQGVATAGTDASQDSARRRFLNEVASVRYLTELELDPPLLPRFYGADLDAGLLLLEDLGNVKTLVDILTDNDADARIDKDRDEAQSLADVLCGKDADAAAAALNAYARTIGRLHAVTVGQEERYAAIRGEAVGDSTRAWAGTGAWVAENFHRFGEVCDALGVPLAPDFEHEVQTVDEAMANPGPFLAFNVSDACPDNHVLAGETVRLFDFEFAGFSHALLEGAYLRLPFPTCWCVGRLPAAVQGKAEQIYRAELIHGCPAAADDEPYGRALLSACAYWTIRSVSWTIQDALKEDEAWGLATHRQRHVYRLETLAQQVEEARFLDEIGRVTAQLAAALRTRWQDTDLELKMYPAFNTRAT